MSKKAKYLCIGARIQCVLQTASQTL